MQAQKQWTKPELTAYGSVEQITEQVNVNVQKTTGSGDSVVLSINGTNTITVADPDNGPAIGVFSS